MTTVLRMEWGTTQPCSVGDSPLGVGAAARQPMLQQILYRRFGGYVIAPAGRAVPAVAELLLQRRFGFRFGVVLRRDLPGDADAVAVAGVRRPAADQPTWPTSLGGRGTSLTSRALQRPVVSRLPACHRLRSPQLIAALRVAPVVVHHVGQHRRIPGELP